MAVDHFISVVDYKAGTWDAADNVIITDSGANIAGMSDADFLALATNNVDGIEANDGSISLRFGQFSGLGTVALTAADDITVTLSANDFGGLTDTAVAALAGKGVDALNFSDAVTLDTARLEKLGVVVFSTASDVTLALSTVEFGALDQAAVTALLAQGVDTIDVEGTDLTLSKATLLVLGALKLAGGDNVTLTLIAEEFRAVDETVAAELIAKGIDTLDVEGTDLTLSKAALDALGTLKLVGTDNVTLELSATEFAAVDGTVAAALIAKGVDTLDVAGTDLTLSKAALDALGTLKLVGTDNVTLELSATEFAAVDGTVAAALIAKGVDTLDVAGADLTLSKAALDALGTLKLVGTDNVTLTLSATEFAAVDDVAADALIAKGVDTLDVAGADLTLSKAALDALGTLKLVGTDNVTLTMDLDTFNGLTDAQLGELAGKGVDMIDVTGDADLTLSWASLTALGAVKLAGGDNVTLMLSADEFLTVDATKSAALIAKGIDTLDVAGTDLSLTLGQSQALGALKLATGDNVTVALTATEYTNLTAATVDALIAQGVDAVDLAGADQAVTLADMTALKTLKLAAGDNVTLSVTAAEYALLDAAKLAALFARGVDSIDIAGADQTLTLAQFEALSGVKLAAGDNVTVTLSTDEFNNLSPATIAALTTQNVDTLDVAGADLQISLAKSQALGTLKLAAGDNVTLTVVLAADLQNLTVDALTAIKNQGVDTIDVAGAAADIKLSLAQVKALGAVAFSAGDTVTVTMTAAELAGLTTNELATFKTRGIDLIDIDGVTNSPAVLTLAQSKALDTVKLATLDDVSVSLSLTELNALTTAEVTALKAQNVDILDVTGATADVTLSLAQSKILDTLKLATADKVVVTLTGDELLALTEAQITALKAQNVDTLDVTGDTAAVSLTLAQSQALNGLKLATGDVVSVSLTATELTALTAANLTALKDQNVDFLDVAGSGTNADVALSLTQATALAGVKLAAEDNVTVSLTAAEYTNLTDAQVTALTALGVDFVDLNGTDQALTLAEFKKFGTLKLAADDKVTVTVSAADFAALSDDDLGSISTKQVDILDVSGDGALALDAAKFGALKGTVSFLAADTITVKDTGAKLAALTADVYKGLAASNIDSFDASDNVLGLSVAQATVLGGFKLASDDVVTVVDTGANLAKLTGTQIAALGTSNVDVLDSSTNVLALNVSQAIALSTSTVKLTAADAVTVTDTGAAISALSAAQLSALAGKGIDGLDATDNALSFTPAQLAALGTLTFGATDSVKINGTSGADNATGTSGNDIIIGNAGNDRLNGAFGNDKIYGGLGKDILTGATGKDIFVFNTKLGKTNTDKITDFSVKDDSIWLDNAVFKKLGKGSEAKPGALSKKFFTIGDHAKTKDQHVIYDSKKGVLYYDVDGSGSAKQVEIATTAKKLKMTAGDFFVV
ncbi:beta strand repeat-containing protein [Microvirga antarctica]|uniref:beta strand repeat-containing protein n=1 Tax=Microvirga antarctica TaxID=2819233 RepID=UPI001B308236